jgi:arylsulfatase A-like enzyme
VACNDHSFGRLLDELGRRGLAENTAVIFLSDHGEEFFEHGGWIHGRTLYREVLQVPLVIRYPGQSEARRIAAPAQHVDLLPTLLELAGLAPQPGVHGTSLLRPPPRGRSVAGFLDLDEWAGWSVVDGARHAVRQRALGYTGPAELFDTELDPEELNDLGGVRGIEAGALLSESRREVLGEEGRYSGGEAEIDDELRRRLEALGYL